MNTRSSAHVHTNFCDGRAPAEEMVRSALERGFVSLGFSSHAPQRFGAPCCVAPERENEYKAEILRLKEKYAGRMLVGAGTVLDTETCRTAILAGADFILSPTLNTEVIRMCNRYGRAAVPGVMTPTEILTALEAGADIVKVFPAGALGAAYIKDVKGPLKQACIMAVGGVSLENTADLFRAGASCVGVGSNLVSKALIQSGSFDGITERAKAFTEAAK